MSLTAIHKRGKAIALLLRKQEYETDLQLKQYRDMRLQQSAMNTQLDAMQLEMNKVRSLLTQGKSLYVDEIIRLQTYLDQLAKEQSTMLMELIKINGTCQKQLADLRKNQARTNALEKRESDCKLEAKQTMDKLQQNSVDESFLSKFHRIQLMENHE
jgi:hypothetical protein